MVARREIERVDSDKTTTTTTRTMRRVERGDRRYPVRSSEPSPNIGRDKLVRAHVSTRVSTQGISFFPLAKSSGNGGREREGEVEADFRLLLAATAAACLVSFADPCECHGFSHRPEPIPLGSAMVVPVHFNVGSRDRPALFGSRRQRRTTILTVSRTRP